MGSFLMVPLLGFEVTREKKYRLLFHSGSFKEQVPKQVFKCSTPKPSLCSFSGFDVRATTRALKYRGLNH